MSLSNNIVTVLSLTVMYLTAAKLKTKVQIMNISMVVTSSWCPRPLYNKNLEFIIDILWKHR